jgi:hypothetical protein
MCSRAHGIGLGWVNAMLLVLLCLKHRPVATLPHFLGFNGVLPFTSVRT